MAKIKAFFNRWKRTKKQQLARLESDDTFDFSVSPYLGWMEQEFRNK